MDFRFHSEGVMLFGMPYVARLTVNKYGEFQKEYILYNPKIDNKGNVVADIYYTAENFEIIIERYGSCSQEDFSTYNLVYRNKLIQLGSTDNEELKEIIRKFLLKKISVCELLNMIDEQIKEQYEAEIDEIFSLYAEDEIDLKTALQEFIDDYETIRVRFNDYHMIFLTPVEKIIMNFCNDDNVYIECENMKLNITLSKIQSHDIQIDNGNINMITLDMEDGTNIMLISMDKKQKNKEDKN